VADLRDSASPPQGAGMIVLSMGRMGYSLICLMSPGPTIMSLKIYSLIKFSVYNRIFQSANALQMHPCC
jgi:hypothetical protein